MHGGSSTIQQNYLKPTGDYNGFSISWNNIAEQERKQGPFCLDFSAAEQQEVKTRCFNRVSEAESSCDRTGAVQG